jgi:asparagine synthase (glutamine-hydrolysing)
MAVSLETRVPFLDHRVVAFAWQLPQHFKIRHGQGKWILRQVLYRYVPKSLIERPKAGFGIPVGAWLRGPLREWAQALLDSDALREQGYLDADMIHAVWQEHLSGKQDHTPKLWAVLMFQAWLNAQG